MSEKKIQQNYVYRTLQQHLDRQPIGFPATSSGVELRVLEHIFSPEEARVAACLTHRPMFLDQIFERAMDLVDSEKQLIDLLESAVEKGGIESGRKGGQQWYKNAPLVVGMYEYQLDRLTPEFIKDFAEYTSDRKFGISFLSTPLPQMRTIPVNKSITVSLKAKDFDRISELLKKSDGPFAICECICRKKQQMLGNTCEVTRRKETCLAVGHLARTAEKVGMGRTVGRETALEILSRNQKEGLVLQPSNARDIEFVCSCCGCCCGILRMHKKLPKPLEFWVANYQATIDQGQCTKCGVCKTKCQVGAIVSRGNDEDVIVDSERCIGCGVCVTACKFDAVDLIRAKEEKIPPENRDELMRIIESGKKGRFGRAVLTGKIIKDALVTRRLDILNPK